MMTCGGSTGMRVASLARVTAYPTAPAHLPPAGVSLLELLHLDRLGDDHFRADRTFVEQWPLYGGQVMAQALVAAGRTVEPGRLPHSLTAWFLRPGDSGQPVELHVDRDRDGGSYSARRVTARQGGEVVLSLSASFTRGDDDPADEVGPRLPDVPGPGEPSVGPRLVDVEVSVPPPDHPEWSWPARGWLRCTADLPEDPLLQSAVLAYISDIFTGLGRLESSAGRSMSTISHALWLHRPTQVSEWHLLDLVPQSVARGRGLYRGELWSADGRLVASVAQESLYRLPRRS